MSGILDVIGGPIDIIRSFCFVVGSSKFGAHLFILSICFFCIFRSWKAICLQAPKLRRSIYDSA